MTPSSSETASQKSLEELENGYLDELPEDVEMSIPIQLDLHVNDDGRVTIGGSPPLFYVDTTVMPVFHQLKVTINVNENSENDARSSQQRMES